MGIEASELPFLTIAQAGAAIASGELSPVDLLRAVQARIDRHEPAVNAFIHLREEAMAEAEQAAHEIAAGRRIGPLHGIPVAIKDLFETAERPTTFGSPHFDGRSDRDAAVVKRLKDAGAIIVGYNNLDEFAFGSFNANEHYGQCRNPWHLDHTSGGSSGGSAAAVAAGFALAAIGTDTGISVRQPAAFCNLVGLKPTYGLIDATGAKPFSHSIDHIGPLTRTVGDSAILLALLGDGVEPGDFAPCADLAGVTLAVPDRYCFDVCQQEVRRLFDAAVAQLRELGAKVAPFAFKHWDELNRVAAIVCRAEAAAFHREAFATRPESFGESMRGFLAEAMAISEAGYRAAQQRRAEISALYDVAVASIDAVVTPTSPHAPAPVSEGAQLNEPVRWRNTGPFASLGVPAVSVPCGFTPSGLPAGLQLAGRRGGDMRLLGLAAAYEAAAGWHMRGATALP